MTFKCNQCGSVKPIAQFYKTKKLKRGHYATCRQCWDERSRKWRADNKEKASSYRRLYRHKNRTLIAALTRKSALKTRYGLTPKEYDALWNAQHGRCAICGIHESETKSRKLCVDHCHRTDRVRGLLCDKCNRGIGAFDDDPERMRKAAEFIQACEEAVKGRRQTGIEVYERPNGREG